MSTRFYIGLMAFGSILAGCSAEGHEASTADSAPLPEVSQREEKLAVDRGHTWAWRKEGRNIPVCFDFPGHEDEKRWMEYALRGQRSWSSHVNVLFTGFGACPERKKGIVVELQTDRPEAYVERLGFNSAFGGPNLNDATILFNLSDSGKCSNKKDSNKENCIITSMLRVVGNALGFSDEHLRKDTPATCSPSEGGLKGDGLIWGPWDGESIMNQCRADKYAGLSGADRAAASYVYAYHDYDRDNKIRTQDYDGDGKDDLLCHDVMSGNRMIKVANSAGSFNPGSDGTNVNGNSWCAAQTDALFKGDFNGDGRADLLCHNRDSGAISIDYGSLSDGVDGSEAEASSSWCPGTENILLVADFNGDRRDDMMCYRITTGLMSIDYAGVDGKFGKTDWESNGPLLTLNNELQLWCHKEHGRLYTGDFNGDKHADLLCHNVDTGMVLVHYVDSHIHPSVTDDGKFDGDIWLGLGAWCNDYPAQMYVGDFNGDGRDDLLCHNAGNGGARDGAMHIALASTLERFLRDGTTFENEVETTKFGFCHDPDNRLYVGDFNGDGRDDVLCHEMQSRRLQELDQEIIYADPNGDLGASSIARQDDFCTGPSKMLR